MGDGNKWHLTSAIDEVLSSARKDGKGNYTGDPEVLSGDALLILLKNNKNTSVEKLPGFYRNGANDEKIRESILKLRCKEICEHKEKSETCEDNCENLLVNNFRACILNVKKKEGDKDTCNSILLLPIIPHEGDTLQKKLTLLKAAVDFLIFLKTKTKNQENINIQLMVGTRSNWDEKSIEAERYTVEARILTTNIKLYIKNKHEEWSDKLNVIPFAPNNNSEVSEDNESLINNAFEIGKINEHNADIVMPINGIAGNYMANLAKGQNLSLSKERDELVELCAIPWFHEGKLTPIGEGGFADEDEVESIKRKKSSKVWRRLQEVITNEISDGGTNYKKQLVEEKKDSFGDKDYKKKLLSLIRACLSLYEEIEVYYFNTGVVHYLPVFKFLDTFSSPFEEQEKVEIEFKSLTSDEAVVTKVSESTHCKKLRIGISEPRSLEERGITISRNIINHLPIWGVSLSNNPKLNLLINKISEEIRPYWHVYSENRFFIEGKSFEGLVLSCYDDKSTVYRILTESLEKNGINIGKDVIFAEEDQNREFELLFKGIVDVAITVSPWAVVEKAIERGQHIALCYEHLGETKDFTRVYFGPIAGNSDKPNSPDNFFTSKEIQQKLIDAMRLLIDDEVNIFYENASLLGGEESEYFNSSFKMVKRLMESKNAVYVADESNEIGRKASFRAGVYAICKSRIYNVNHNDKKKENNYKRVFEALMKEILLVEQRQDKKAVPLKQLEFYSSYHENTKLAECWEIVDQLKAFGKITQDGYHFVTRRVLDDSEYLSGIYHLNSKNSVVKSEDWDFVDELVDKFLLPLIQTDKDINDSDVSDWKKHFIALHTDHDYKDNNAENITEIRKLYENNIRETGELETYLKQLGWSFSEKFECNFKLGLHFYYFKGILGKFFPSNSEYNRICENRRVEFHELDIDGKKFGLMLFSYIHKKPSTSAKWLSRGIGEIDGYNELDLVYIEHCLHSFFFYKDINKGNEEYANLHRISEHSEFERYIVNDGRRSLVLTFQGTEHVVELSKNDGFNCLLGFSFRLTE